MKVWVAVLFLLLSATGGWAKVFKLPNQSRLELFPVGRWQIAGEDLGEFKIVLVPENSRINARAILSVATEGSDDFPTDVLLQRQMVKVAERVMLTGDFVERKPVVKPFYPPQGFGYYTLLTERKMVGRAPVAGDFKLVCLGLIRLAPAVLLKIQILSDGEETEEFQQLLGMAEGAAFTPP